MNKYKKENYITQRLNKNSNKWIFQVRVPGAKEKSFSETIYGSSRDAYENAIKYRNKCLSSKTQKNNQFRDDIYLDEIFDETFLLLPVREETKRKHTYFFKNHIDTNKPISEIKRADILLSLNNMVTTSSDSTIQHVFSVWKRIFKTAVVKEYIMYDLTQGIIPPKSQYIPKHKSDVVTTRETLDKVEERISDTFGVEKDSVIMALEVMWHTGMRPAECFALSPTDFKDGYISITKELGSSMADDGFVDKEKFGVVRTCKTDTSVRQIPISNKLAEKLNSYKVKGDIMFPNKYGEYFNIGQLGQRIHKLGIPFRMYQLRHTVATKMIVDSNADDRTIQEVLGHKSFKMSIYYARSNEEKKLNVLNEI